jgi:hypothetical protein
MPFEQAHPAELQQTLGHLPTVGLLDDVTHRIPSPIGRAEYYTAAALRREESRRHGKLASGVTQR